MPLCTLHVQSKYRLMYIYINSITMINHANRYLFIIHLCQHSTEEIFVLVSWPEENNDVSVISSIRNHISEPMIVGKMCNVNSGKKTYPAMVHATGRCKYNYVYIHMCSLIC